ncbi:hypothetical protein CAD93_20760 [Salmonella enterica subsp. enterica serovar Tennessee]|nr:hypothetical protein [Salmonella enterica subsp. enterica serovar Tennessee]
MIVPTGVYVGVLCAWCVFIFFFGAIKKILGPLTYVLCCLLAGLVFSMKTADSKPMNWTVISNGIDSFIDFLFLNPLLAIMIFITPIVVVAGFIFIRR